MVAYSFKKRFGPPILAGTKAQTIRAERAGKSRHAHPGELVQLYTGMRTRQCQRLGEARCSAVWPIKMNLIVGIVFANDGWIRTASDLDEFARQDGFQDWWELVAFWVAEHPGVDLFEGVLIRWQPLAPAGRTRHREGSMSTQCTFTDRRPSPYRPRRTWAEPTNQPRPIQRVLSLDARRHDPVRPLGQFFILTAGSALRRSWPIGVERKVRLGVRQADSLHVVEERENVCVDWLASFFASDETVDHRHIVTRLASEVGGCSHGHSRALRGWLRDLERCLPPDHQPAGALDIAGAS